MHDCDATQVDAGQQISRAGDVRDEAFLLLTGELFVGAADAGAPEERERKRAGEFVGEKAFLSGHKRVHDICAGAEPVELLVLSRILFEKAMAKLPAVAVKILW